MNADPYSELIKLFIMQEFPTGFHCDSTAVLDLVTEAIVASGQTRYGPRPSPESLVEIRKILSHYITQSRPIPFMTPWGSEKPDGSGVDIAELMALKTIISLNGRVSPYYPPGVQVSIRLEDLSAPHLFHWRMDEARIEAERYTTGLVNLVKVLNLNSYIFPTPESSYGVDEDRFNATADEMLPVFIKAVTFPGEKQPELEKLGWQGGISPSLVNHYMTSYDKMYPGKLDSFKLNQLARYFSASLTRKKLGFTGALKEWDNKYLQLSFIKHPGGPVSPTRIHYRTIPSSITSNHLPPWRAKGYLCIDETHATAKLASYNEHREYNPYVFSFERDGLVVPVQADYLLCGGETSNKDN